MSKSTIFGWVLSGLLAMLLIGASAGGKFVAWEGKSAMLQKLGFSPELMTKIGVLEVVVTVLFLVPRTAFVGAILLTGYIGGATVTHLRVGEPIVMPVAIGVVAWIALGLRNPTIWSLAAGSALERARKARS